MTVFNKIYDFFIYGPLGIAGLLIFAALITALVFTIMPMIGKLFNYIEAVEMRGLIKFLPVKLTMFFANRLTIFGVIVHEFSHMIMAKLTGARVTQVSVLDISKNGMLGHVNIVPTGNKLQQRFQLTLTSCAPIIGGFIVIFLLLILYPNFGIMGKIIDIFLIISVVNHLSMSPQDIALYKKGLIFVIPVFYILLFLCLYLFRRV